MSPDDSSILYKRAGRGLPKRELSQFALDLRTRVSDGYSFTCLFTDDKELARLNQQFLGKTYATDVLSFPSGGGASIGDLAISVDRAREQAVEHGHSLTDELKILMLHGVLHLTGLDHERDRGVMARTEKRWRAEFGLPEGLIERSRRARA